MKKRPLLFIAMLLSLQMATAQKLLYQASGIMTKLSTISVGDSLLFNYKETLGNDERQTENYNAKWVTDSASYAAPTLSLKRKNHGHLLPAIAYGHETYRYYTHYPKDKFFIKALIVDMQSRIQYLPDSIRVSGNILGTFVDNGHLFVVTMDANAYDMTILEINRLQVVDRSTYKLGVRLYSPNIEFFTSASELDAFKGNTRCKFYKYNEKFYLTIDIPGKHTHNTFIITLDPITKQASMQKLNAKTNNFSSFLLDDKVFRESIEGRTLVVTIYDLASLQPIAKKIMQLSDPECMVYFRDAKKNIINKESSSRMLQKAPGSLPVISVLKKDGHYIIHAGTYFEPDMDVITGNSGLGGLFLSILITGFLQYLESPGDYRYFYYVYDPESSNITFKDDSLLLLREKIDNYEIEESKNNIGHKFKNYVTHNNGILATYYSEQNSVSLIYFE
jgi:hypothetical protein